MWVICAMRFADNATWDPPPGSAVNFSSSTSPHLELVTEAEIQALNQSYR